MKESVPLVRFVGGRPCWKRINEDAYQAEPALEALWKKGGDMADDWGLLDKDGAAEPTCSECENILDWVECNECGGDGMGDHDCGEDCCACLDPEPNTLCSTCGGAGGWYWCWTCKRID